MNDEISVNMQIKIIVNFDRKNFFLSFFFLRNWPLSVSSFYRLLFLNSYDDISWSMEKISWSNSDIHGE